MQNDQFSPIELVVVQPTSFCNLNCSYCYLSEETRKTKGQISLPLLSLYFSKILSSRYLGNHLVISWHSGEPLVLGIGYYEAAIDEISRLKTLYCAPDFEIVHDIQTNGTLIDDNWCAFFDRHRDDITIGISCDGPAFLHNAYRKDWRNLGTWDNTQKGIDLLAKHHIPFSLIAVVSPKTLDYPDEFFNFFYSYRSDISEFRFNLLDEFNESGEFSYENSQKYYNFLQQILDRLEAIDSKDELLNIKNFSYFYDRMFSSPEEKLKLTAHFSSLPFRAINIASNGDFSTFYAGVTVDECADVYGDNKGLVVGNLNNQSLDEIAESLKLRRIMKDFQSSHSLCEKSCPYFELCPGGYNLVKFKRHGNFNVAETPECVIQVQTFSNALIDHIEAHLEV